MPRSDSAGPPAPQAFRPGLMQLDPPRLLGSRCTACGTAGFPARPFCPHCRATDGITGVVLSPQGRVHSFTVVRQAPPGVEVPYVLAYVDLDDGVRVMAQVAAPGPGPSDGRGVEIGTPVRLELAPVATAGQEEELMGYRFTTCAATEVPA